MEAILLAKRTLFNIPKIFPQGPPRYAQFSRKISTRAAASENSDVREGMMEARQRVFDAPDEKPPGISTSVAADMAKDGIRKATEAGKAGRERELVSDDQIEEDPAVGEIENVEGPIDTQEYRGIEELMGKTGGFMRADQV